MTQKIRKFKLLLILILAGLLLYSCQEEEFDNRNEDLNSEKIKEQSLREALQNPVFYKSYHKVIDGVTQINSTNRSISNLLIDSTIIKEITVNGNTTFTMAIKNPTFSGGVFENLIIHVTNLDSTSAFLAKYTPIEEMIYLPAHNSTTFKGTTEISEVTFDTSNSQSKFGRTCVTVKVCDYDYLHLAGSGCKTTRPMEVCWDTQGTAAGNGGFGGVSVGYGGSSSGTAGSSGNSGAGSNGSSNPNPVTAPVVPPCVGCFAYDESPCGKLSDNSNKPQFKQKFRNLNKQSVFNLPNESGFNEFIVNGVSQLVDGTSAGTSHMTLPPNATSSTHVHNNSPQTKEDGTIYDGGVKILSPRDLKELIKTLMFNNVAAGNTAAGTHVDMLSNEGIFSLVVMDNSLSYLTDIAPVLNKLGEDYKKLAENIILGDNTTDQRKEKLQKMLLGLLKQHNLESKIGLFEGDVQTLQTILPNTNPPLRDIKINWKQKTLNPDGTLAEKPC